MSSPQVQMEVGWDEELQAIRDRATALEARTRSLVLAERAAMVEPVARAICRQFLNTLIPDRESRATDAEVDSAWPDWKKEAVAAIAAMAEGGAEGSDGRGSGNPRVATPPETEKNDG